MTYIGDFVKTLNELIDEQFPNTIRYAVKSGDHVEDIVLELREDDKKLRYSPYKMYKNSDNYEDTIEALLNQWEKMLQ